MITAARARVRARLRSEAGFTLVELVTALGIMSVVLAGIMALFVAGIRAEVDQNERFRSQQQARVALATLRREVRTACWYDSSPAALARFPATVTLGYCKDATSVLRVTSQVSWCAVSVGTQRYALFRQSGPACGSVAGARKADRLVSSSVFGIVRDAYDVRPKLTVSLDVDANTATKGGHYVLADQIMFRNFRDGTAP